MNSIKLAVLAVLCSIGLLGLPAFAADNPYAEGSVWTVTMVRVKPGMDSVYLRDLSANWRRVMDEAKKQNLVVSYKILNGTGSSRDDWTMLLMTESKNWGAFDGASDKFDAIAEKMIGPEKTQMETMVKRSDMREIIGTRNFQEINFK